MFRIRTLGTIELSDFEAGAPPAAPLQPKHLALLVYLAVQAQQGFQRRDSLAAMFWPDLDAHHARSALRKALHFIRATVGAPALLTRGDDDVRVDPAQCWCDAREMRDLSATGALEESVALYRGDFLHGFHISDALEFEHWLERERIQLRTLASENAYTLAVAAHAAGDLHTAVRHARRAVTLAPLESRPNHLLLRVLDAIGDRPAALAHYQRFAQHLEQEMELQPDEAMQRLVAKWRRPRTDAPALPEPPEPTTLPPVVPAASTLGDNTRPRPSRRRRSAALGAVALALTTAALLALSDENAPSPYGFTVLAHVSGTASAEDLLVTRSLVESALTQEARLTPLGADELRRGLQQMGRPDTVRIDEALARELAYRAGVGSAVTARLDVAGAQYALTLSVLDSESGHVRASARVTADNRDALIAASGDAAARLATQLSPSDYQADAGLVGRRYDVSTASFDAFRLWVLGAQETQRAQFTTAERLLREAIRHDPGFVNAWVSLANVLNGTGQRDSMFAVLARLDTLPNRNPMDARRKRWMSALVRSQYPEALAVIDEVLALEHPSAGNLNNRAIVLAALGRREEAVRTERAALTASRFGPRPLHIGNYVAFLADAGRPDLARASLDSLRRACGDDCEVLSLVRIADNLDILLDDWANVEEAARVHRSAVAVSTVHMRRGAARAAWQALADARATGSAPRNSELLIALAAPHAVGTPTAPPRADSIGALQWRGIWAALQGDSAAARHDAARLRAMLLQPYRGAAPEFIDALIARRGNRPRDVIDALAPVTRIGERGRSQQDAHVGPLAIHWVMAEAYEQVGQLDSAIAMYERVLHPRDGELHFLALRGLLWSQAHHRLAVLEQRSGHHTAARRHAQAFAGAFTQPDRELAGLLRDAAALRIARR